jgi:hypothetical protein
VSKPVTDEKTGVNVVVAVPSHEDVKAFFAYDLAQLMFFTSRYYMNPDVIAHLGLALQAGTYVHTARQLLKTVALEAGADFVLFLDSDMRFPPDLLAKLLTHDKPMVGVNYPSRVQPFNYIAIKRLAVGLEDRGELLVTGPDSTGLEQVEALGFGAVLVRRDVLEAVQESVGTQPSWWFEWTERDTLMGEDVYFCREAARAGFEIFVDHDMSKRMFHIGMAEFSLEHVWAQEDLNE